MANCASPATIATLITPATRPPHEVRRHGRGDHIGDVPEEERRGSREGEAAIPATHFLESGAVLHLQVDVRRPTGRLRLGGGCGKDGRRGSDTVHLAPAGGERIPPGVVEPDLSGFTTIVLFHRTLLVRGELSREHKDEQCGKTRDAWDRKFHPFR
ncbi:hypothetical protein GA0115246_114037 [Streptomyces sp. SolWspMP-sol7th]|nr:hypothetical protein GA0115246_114037 [Streptomyces sp. SolWspMP-sol7th]